MLPWRPGIVDESFEMLHNFFYFALVCSFWKVEPLPRPYDQPPLIPAGLQGIYVSLRYFSTTLVFYKIPFAHMPFLLFW